MKTHPLVAVMAAVVVLTGLSGCVAAGIFGGVVAVAALPVGAHAIVEGHDKSKRSAPEEIAIEAELRARLPSPASATARTASEPPPAAAPARINFSFLGDFTPRTEGSRNVSQLSITISGAVSPSTARLLVEGVRQIAWRRAEPIGLEIYGQPDPAGEPRERPGFSIFDPFYVGRGFTKLARQDFNPYDEVRKKLAPLMPSTVTGRTTLWGQKQPGDWWLDPGPRFAAAGDFSPESAQAFIEASKSAFPFMAVTVYRDETRQRSGWKKIATYHPPPGSPPGQANPPTRPPIPAAR